MQFSVIVGCPGHGYREHSRKRKNNFNQGAGAILPLIFAAVLKTIVRRMIDNGSAKQSIGQHEQETMIRVRVDMKVFVLAEMSCIQAENGLRGVASVPKPSSKLKTTLRSILDLVH